MRYFLPNRLLFAALGLAVIMMSPSAEADGCGNMMVGGCDPCDEEFCEELCGEQTPGPCVSNGASCSGQVPPQCTCDCENPAK
jgi:hypothetical protein